MKRKQKIDVEFGKRLRRARELAGYTREQFAELLDCSISYVSDMERGACNASLPTLKRICEALHLSADSLLWEPLSMPASYYDTQASNLNDENMARLNKIIQLFIEAAEK